MFIYVTATGFPHVVLELKKTYLTHEIINFNLAWSWSKTNTMLSMNYFNNWCKKLPVFSSSEESKPCLAKNCKSNLKTFLDEKNFYDFRRRHALVTLPWNCFFFFLCFCLSNFVVFAWSRFVGNFYSLILEEKEPVLKIMNGERKNFSSDQWTPRLVALEMCQF